MRAPTWRQYTGTQPKRKRAELACVICHSKKIKCDLQVRGGQGYSNCTNCANAGRDCRSRPSKRGAAKQAKTAAHPQPVTPPEDSNGGGDELQVPPPAPATAPAAGTSPVQHRASVVNENVTVARHDAFSCFNDAPVSDSQSNHAPTIPPPLAEYPRMSPAHVSPSAPAMAGGPRPEDVRSFRRPPLSDHASPHGTRQDNQLHPQTGRRPPSIPHGSPATQTSEVRPEPRGAYPVDTGFSHVYGPERQVDARNQELRNAERPLEHSMVLPEPGLQQSFAETYFEYCYTWCPVLDRQRLPIELAHSPLLVNAVALVGSHINPPMLPHDGPATYYERARNKFYNDEEPDVMISLKAISLFYWWSPRPPSILHRHSSWWWTSVVIRHCQQLGIHREPAPHHPLRHSIDLSLRKKIWWTAFARERLTALCQNKPCVIDPDDCNISEPTLDDFPDEQDKPKGEIFIYWIRLCGIIGRIAKYLLRSVSSDPAAPFPVELGRELIGWVQSLPPHLQLPISADRTTSFNRDVHQLHLPYLTVIIILHLKRSSAPLPQAYPPAILAASCVARILKDTLARGATRYLMAITGWYCGTAYIALLQACRIEGLAKAANEDLDILELAGKQLGKMWPTANVFYHGFHRLRAMANSNDRDATAAAANPRPLESTEIGAGGMNIVNGIDWMEYFPFATTQTSGVAATLLAPHTEEMFLDDAFPEAMLHFEDLFSQYNSFTDIDLFM
ncbi:hypothetical protein VTO42DRAFT_317 [Malbranchea cinnamomea]